MAEVRPLALRRQKTNAAPRARKFSDVAAVLIDTGAYHLVEPFSYGIPEDISSRIKIGSKVEVSFQNDFVEGIVWSIDRDCDQSVKPISAVKEVQPLSQSFLSSCQEIANRYGCRIADILRFVPEIPGSSNNQQDSDRGAKISFEVPESNIYIDALEMPHGIKGRSLLIAPTDREVEFLFTKSQELSKGAIAYHSGMSAAHRKRARLEMANDPDCLVIGTRGSIFLPIPFQRVRVIHDFSPHYWERKGPYWNLRDVALLRARTEGFALEFLGYVPSLELARLIDTGYVRSKRPRKKPNTRRFTFATDSYHEGIRRGLKTGKVLVSVIDKAYSSSFICARCRNLPTCECGGRYRLADADSISCGLCFKKLNGWSCSECGGAVRFMLRRGAARIGEELGRAFPNVPILLATSEQRAPQPVSGSITVATPGMEPLGVEFNSLILLDGESALQRHGLRSEEVLQEYWQRLVMATSSEASIHISLPRSHRISQSILIGNQVRFLSGELKEREELGLPPFKRIIKLRGEDRDLVLLRDELMGEFPGLIPSGIAAGEIILRCDLAESPAVIRNIYALQRYRSATRRKPFEVRIDPFEI